MDRMTDTFKRVDIAAPTFGDPALAPLARRWADLAAEAEMLAAETRVALRGHDGARVRCHECGNEPRDEDPAKMARFYSVDAARSAFHAAASLEELAS